MVKTGCDICQEPQPTAFGVGIGRPLVLSQDHVVLSPYGIKTRCPRSSCGLDDSCLTGSRAYVR
jgi:hypothetical protein